MTIFDREKQITNIILIQQLTELRKKLNLKRDQMIQDQENPFEINLVGDKINKLNKQIDKL
jgi:hypothetical protein